MLIRVVHARTEASRPDGKWGNRWSVGFYITHKAFAMHQRLGALLQEGAGSSVAHGARALGLAPSLMGFGLPDRAKELRALQPGGWLAERLSAGAPWPLLSDALGRPVLLSNPGTMPRAVYRQKSRRPKAPLRNTRSSASRKRTKRD